MPAFQGAVDLGYRYLETDVHATSDGVLMAFHDSTLDRVTDMSGVIGELPYEHVRTARVDGVEPIPLFEDLITTFPDARFNIDPKHDRSVGPLLAMIRRLGVLDRVCIGAFSERRLLHIRAELGPGACLGLGPRSIARLRLGPPGGRNRSFPGHVAQVPTHVRRVRLVDERFLDRAHRSGLVVHVWTVDEAEEMRRLLDLGVDGIMTDRPGVLRDVLVARGQWVP